MCTKVISLQECSEARPGQLERVKFFPRMLLTVEDMVTESEYHREKLKRHNLYLHGPGIVCGLEVTPAPSPAPSTAVQIGGGYALGPFGDEIFVGEPVILDLAKCGPGAATNPCEPSIIRGGNGVGATVIVAIKFAECLARPVRAMPAGCACEDEDCEYSRIRDSFQISCLDPRPIPPTIPSLCDFIHGIGSLTCPTPTEPWLPLARVTLPTGGSAMSPNNIDDSVRNYVFSTAIIQDQLITSCCGDGHHEPPPPPRKVPVKVTQVNPPNGSKFSTIQFGAGNAPTAVVLTFDKRLNRPTISHNITVTRSVGGQNPQPVAGATRYDDKQMQATFTPEQGFSGDANGAVYTVIARGSGATPLKDLDDLALDGNGDGTAGGDFSSTFTVSFMIA